MDSGISLPSAVGIQLVVSSVFGLVFEEGNWSISARLGVSLVVLELPLANLVFEILGISSNTPSPPDIFSILFTNFVLISLGMFKVAHLLIF